MVGLGCLANPLFFMPHVQTDDITKYKHTANSILTLTSPGLVLLVDAGFTELPAKKICVAPQHSTAYA